MIQIEKLKKIYDNGHEALKNINLEINNDSILFLDCTRLDGQKELVSREKPNQNDSRS